MDLNHRCLSTDFLSFILTPTIDCIPSIRAATFDTYSWTFLFTKVVEAMGSNHLSPSVLPPIKSPDTKNSTGCNNDCILAI